MKGSVQQKIRCLFKTHVKEEPSEKSKFQTYSVFASEELQEDVDISVCFPSEKVDGTCCYVSEFCGKPWLWARHDRKASKSADKRFKRFKAKHMSWKISGCEEDEPKFQWDVMKDFKETPDNWIPALGVPTVENVPQPDENGHTPGWVPVDPTSRAHCWHNSAVDVHVGIALVLRMEQGNVNSTELELSIVSLTELMGTTLELIGTNINGNPYGLGSKAVPIHVLVPHGCIRFSEFPPLNMHKLIDWFETEGDGKVEGVVWQFQDEKLFKVHRHHLKLKWPITETRLSAMPVTINTDLFPHEMEWDPKSLLYKFSSVNRKHFKHLKEISFTGLENSDAI